MQKKDVIYIIGCGGHARSVADVLISNGTKSIVFVDNHGRPGETVLGFPVITALPEGIMAVHVASGDNQTRANYGALNSVTIIAANAYISGSCQIGEGSFIAHNAYCAVEAQIGKGCIINTGAVVEHQVIVGNYTHIAPNSTICGKCRIGNNVLIGAGTTIKPGITIADNIVVGSGAVIVSDLTEPGIYFGVPARLQKKSI